ncbi:MAG TPA: DUF4168 domain-containing protein [Longimicrobiales bacterium]|nr:DUF4168 domain-containing protein [Longimicrobiales bacterium]
MRIRNVLGAAALMGAMAAALPAGVNAQQPVPQAPQQEPAMEITDELLERFVAVYPEVVNVAQAAQTQLAVVETPEEAQAIQADAQEQIATLLEEGEVSTAEYEAVVTQLNGDPELRTRFEELLAEQQAGTP